MTARLDLKDLPYLSTGQAAKFLLLSRQHLWRLVKSGTFRGVQVTWDGEHMIPTTEIQRYRKELVQRDRDAADRGRVNLSDELEHETET